MGPLPIVAIQGGLGNQLFQWFYAHEIRETSEFTLLVNLPKGKTTQKIYPFGLDPLIENCRHYSELPQKGIGASIYRVVPYLFDGLWRFKSLRTALRTLGYYREDPRLSSGGHLRVPKNTFYAKGYFQKWEYVETQRDKVVLELIPILRNIFHELKSRFDLSEPYVAIHVRRGDYRTDRNPETMIGSLADQYFSLWIEKHPNIRIILLTENRSETEELEAVIRPTLVLDSLDISVWETLSLMTHADHFLGSNSSLSWWGAWAASINGSATFLPDKWDCMSRFTTSDFLFPTCNTWPVIWESINEENTNSS